MYTAILGLRFWALSENAKPKIAHSLIRFRHDRDIIAFECVCVCLFGHTKKTVISHAKMAKNTHTHTPMCCERRREQIKPVWWTRDRMHSQILCPNVEFEYNPHFASALACVCACLYLNVRTRTLSSLASRRV